MPDAQPIPVLFPSCTALVVAKGSERVCRLSQMDLPLVYFEVGYVVCHIMSTCPWVVQASQPMKLKTTRCSSTLLNT